MNKVTLSGRLTRDPEVKYTQSENPMCIARYSLAVEDHRHKDADGNYDVDYPRIVAFGKAGQFAENYLKKGMKMEITGRLKTGSYTKEDGTTVYTTEVYADEQEFAESKAEYERRKANDGNSGVDVRDNSEKMGKKTIEWNNDIDDGLPFV